jgi:WD40 repeat protein
MAALQVSPLRVAYQANSSTLLSGSASQMLKVWDPRTFQVWFEPPSSGHSACVNSIAVVVLCNLSRGALLGISFVAVELHS